jgi:hypothetical protein
MQMVQLSATRCSSNAILSVSLVSFASITLCVASQRVIIVVSVYFVTDSVRKLLDTPSYGWLSGTAKHCTPSSITTAVVANWDGKIINPGIWLAEWDS